MPIGTKRMNLITVSLMVTLGLYSISTVSAASRPFWTEKSAFIEGDDLFAVGVASKARTVEEGRRQAFEQGKVELMNYAQITSLEAQGLVVETQVILEEPQADGTVTVYRLLRVPASKLIAIQSRLQSQSRAHEQTLEQSRKELAATQATLREKAMKLDQQQRQIEQMLQQINPKLALKGTPNNRSEQSGSLADHLKETKARLDADEQELNRLYLQVKERIKSSSQNACQYVTNGMKPSEVRSLLGIPDGETYAKKDTDDTWAYGTTSVDFNGQGVVIGIRGCQR